MKIVAVSGSPVRGGNVDSLLVNTIEGFKEKPGLEFRLFFLSGMDVLPCSHCNWCLKKQRPGHLCAIEDDMLELYIALDECDGLLIASPVHFLRLSALTANFIDRLRIYYHGNLTSGTMRNKVGGAIAVSWYRDAGIDLTIQTIYSAFHVLKMVVAAPDSGVLGGGACTSLYGTGAVVKGRKKSVLEDEYGLATAKSVVERMIELCEIMVKGRAGNKVAGKSD